jgi:hypothetical protein
MNIFYFHKEIILKFGIGKKINYIIRKKILIVLIFGLYNMLAMIK